MIWALLITPAVAGLLAMAIRPNWPRRVLLVATAAAHTAMTVVCWCNAPAPAIEGWLAIDAGSLLFLSITSVLFLAAAVYAVGYLASESGSGRHHAENNDGEELPFVNFPEAVFVGCLLLFLATMTLVIVSRHLGLMWVGVEATTLASAPLIYFHRHHRSLEATWKYLLICSVGIALALLGNFFVAAATRTIPEPVHLTIDELLKYSGELKRASELSIDNPANPAMWLKAAFLFFLVGYGTKMGLAPMHTWLPDAHSEAPSVVSALLSGALLNCAFLAILRVHSLLAAIGQYEFSADLLVLFGLISMGVAAVFIIGQADFKRMLAYSSVEHMGILALGVGIGGAAVFGSMLHAVNHSLTKAALFFTAGNILAFYRTKSTARVRGLRTTMPITGALWLVGFLAIAGSPPFGPFLSELTILKGIIDAGRYGVAVGYLLALAVIFIAMAAIVLRMVYGEPRGVPRDEAGNPESPRREPLWSIVSPLAMFTAVLVLGVYVPPWLSQLLEKAAGIFGRMQ